MKRGRLIFLNGVTSTGKSTTAECIRDMSREIFYTSSNDIFHDMVSWDRFEGSFWKLVAHTITAQYHAVRGMLDGGFNVIIDGMFLDLPEYRELFGKSNMELFREIFSGCDYLTVDLVCDPDELRRRNRIRGDRGENQSDEQLSKMTYPLQPDMTIDVMTVMPDECAEMILERAGIPFERMSADRRERRRARILSGILDGYDAEVSVTASGESNFIRCSPVIENAVTVKSADAVEAVKNELLRRGYLPYHKECAGFSVVQREFCGEITEIIRIKQKASHEYTDLTEFLGKEVTVIVDRPLGKVHPHHPDMMYTVNYGYIQGTMAGDGEEADAYILGVGHPVSAFTGTAAAVIHRYDDSEDKLVVVPQGITMHADEILSAVSFAEQYFDPVIYLPK